MITLDENEPMLVRLLRRTAALNIPTTVVADSDVRATLKAEACHCVLSNVRFVMDDFVGAAAALALGVSASQTPWSLVTNADTIVPTDILAWGQTTQPRADVHQLLCTASNQNAGLVGINPDSHLIEFHGEARKRQPQSILKPGSTSGVSLIRTDAVHTWGHIDSMLGFDRDVIPELMVGRGVSADLLHSRSPVYDFGTLSRLRDIRADHGLRNNLMAGAHLSSSCASRPCSVDSHTVQVA